MPVRAKFSWACLHEEHFLHLFFKDIPFRRNRVGWMFHYTYIKKGNATQTVPLRQLDGEIQKYEHK
jgi:hypothetical protein